MICATCPKVEPNGYYSITATAAALGMHRNSILNYTMRGIINPEYRKETYRKVYRGSEIIRFWKSRIN